MTKRLKVVAETDNDFGCLELDDGRVLVLEPCDADDAEFLHRLATLFNDHVKERVAPKYVCSRCGSEDVRRDAYAVQDPETGAWELGPVFDQAYCEHCGETTLKEAEA